MKFSVVLSLPRPPAPLPIECVTTGEDFDWANAFLDSRYSRSSPYDHFAVSPMTFSISRAGSNRSTRRFAEITESTIVDYVRHQLEQIPNPHRRPCNHRLGAVRCCYRFHTGREIPAGKVHFQRRLYPTVPARLRPAPPARVGLGPPPSNKIDGSSCHFLPKKLRSSGKVSAPIVIWLSSATCGAAPRWSALPARSWLFSWKTCNSLKASCVRFGKGNKKRVVPLPPEILEVLPDVYLRLARPPNQLASIVRLLERPAPRPGHDLARLRSLFRHHRVLSQVRRPTLLVGFVTLFDRTWCEQGCRCPPCNT